MLIGRRYGSSRRQSATSYIVPVLSYVTHQLCVSYKACPGSSLKDQRHVPIAWACMHVLPPIRGARHC